MNATVDGLVSVIVPVHNRPALLQEAVASAIAQTYRPIEVIIVDDGSTDETTVTARQLAAGHPNIVVAIEQANAGPGPARESGRKAASGEFIQYLDSDDILLPRKFEWQVAALRQRPDCGVAYGMTSYSLCRGERGLRPWKRTGEQIDRMFPSMLRSRWWGTSTPLYRRSITDVAGAWLALINEEDWEYDCRIAVLDVGLVQVPEFVSEERDHVGSRLSKGGASYSDKLRDRARAHSLILKHARKAGIGREASEMKHFARELFLLARQCGAAGLGTESRELFRLARLASESRRARGLDFKIYRLAAGVLGWSIAGRIACWTDRFRV